MAQARDTISPKFAHCITVYGKIHWVNGVGLVCVNWEAKIKHSIQKVCVVPLCMSMNVFYFFFLYI